MKQIERILARALLVITLLALSCPLGVEKLRGEVTAPHPKEQRLVARVDLPKPLTPEQLAYQYKSQMKLDKNFVLNLQKLDAKLYCLAVNNYYEAGGESFIGKVAVAEVVKNRTRHPPYPKDFCGVVQQTTDVQTTTLGENGEPVISTSRVCQFSWYCMDGKGEVPLLDSDGKLNHQVYRMWYDSVVAAILVAQGKISGVVKGATNFYATKEVKPDWSNRYVTTEVIGGHTFMKPRRR